RPARPRPAHLTASSTAPPSREPSCSTPPCYFVRDARAVVAATTPAEVHTFVGLPLVMSQISAVNTSALAWIAAPGFDFASDIVEATWSGVIPDNTVER